MYNDEYYDFNEMKVYGNRDQLEKFMADVHGDGKSVFCLDKIFDMQEITPDRLREPFPGLVNYRTIYLKNRFSDAEALLSDKVEYLKYSFVSNYLLTGEIYEILMHLYPELQFKIFIQDSDDNHRYEIEIKEAEYEKYIEFYWKEVPCIGNIRKLMLYKDNKLKKALQVVEEKYIFPETTQTIVMRDDQERRDEEDLLAELDNMEL